MLSGEANAVLSVFASPNLAEVVPMGCIACPHTSRSIAVGIVGPFTDFNVGHAVVDGGSLAGREPVLHVCVSVP